MIDFTPGAYPDGDGLRMLTGTGEMRGRTMRLGEKHYAMAILGDRYKVVGTAESGEAAYDMIERWYASQENYYAAFDAAFE
jgi:hypothetical protein